MSATMTKRELPEPGRRLVELMQDLNYGRIENLRIRDGVPVYQPSPRVIRECKMGGENEPRRERPNSDFLLKAQIVEAFDLFRKIGVGTIAVIEVKAGLPFRILFEELVR